VNLTLRAPADVVVVDATAVESKVMSTVSEAPKLEPVIFTAVVGGPVTGFNVIAALLAKA
jgi:hypothetical protein